MVKSLRFSPAPSLENCDRPLLNAALRDRRSVVLATPGARITSSTAVPSRIGSSEMRRASTTCPSPADVPSTTAAVALTVTSSLSVPGFNVASIGQHVGDVQPHVLADELAEAVERHGDAVGAGDQERDAVVAFVVRGRGGGEAGRGVGDFDGRAWDDGAAFIGDAALDGAAGLLCVKWVVG